MTAWTTLHCADLVDLRFCLSNLSLSRAFITSYLWKHLGCERTSESVLTVHLVTSDENVLGFYLCIETLGTAHNQMQLLQNFVTR